MRNQNRKSPGGLILLVVLSMLTLFSLLAITYVVFSSQARSASMGMARKDFRGTPPSTLLDESVRQILRGTDSRSGLWKHSLLEDLYGSGATDPISPNENWIELFPRSNSRDNPARVATFGTGAWDLPNLPAIKGTLEAPQILGSRLVNIPLQWRDDSTSATVRSWLPEQHDVWNGRIVTFINGPLAGRSFRVVRYMGEINDLASPQRKYPQSLQYSITVDLSDLPQAFSSYFASATDIYSLFYNGTSPYRMLLNAGVLNSFGSGVAMDGTPQKVSAASNIGFLSKLVPPFNQLTYADIETALLPNYSYARIPNSTFSPAGDSDEPWDAADYANFFLSYKFPSSGGIPTDDVIPSYHRPAIINHIYSKVVTAKGGLPSFTPLDLFSTIELLQRTTARPLSFTVRNLPSPDFDAYAVPITSTTSSNIVSQNASFSGTNLGDYAALAPLTPELDINWANWTTSPTEQLKFQAWVRWLQRGPWDVDSDGDGVTDSIWADLNLPLMTSPEGKLLKMMAAIYIEDMGGRLNLNASGSSEQAASSYSGFDASDGRFAYSSSAGKQLPQGMGFGTADISLRHLFPDDARYLRFIRERYGANQNTPPANFAAFTPGANPVLGVPTNDPANQLHERHRASHNPNMLPGFPLSVFGRSGLGIDLFGNPLIYDDVATNEINDDPYESRLTTSYRDSLLTTAEWERLYRVNDWDRSTLPERLEALMGLSGINAVTPLSSSTIAAKAGGSYKYSHLDPNGGGGIETVTRRVSAFSELLEALAQKRFNPGTYPYFDENALAQLLPLEFRHNLPLDPNRPLGNGQDDDADNVIDEQDELAFQNAEYPAGNYTGIPEQYSNAAGSFDPQYEALPPGPLKTRFNGNQGRQLLARHLYCLAQLILPDKYVFPNTDPGSSYNYGDAERARILAQWAVNVVDFRDTDGAMTRFAYDNDPLTVKAGNFWVPNDGVVWGQEQPELLLTETLAFHDLRISPKTSPPPPPGTNKWQQLRIPQGSLFLELMSTRSGGNRSGGGGGSTVQRPGVPRGNLYDANGDLNVSAVSPPDDNSPASSYPVWRVLLTDPLLPANAGDSAFGKYANATTRAMMQYQTETNAGLKWSFSSPPPSINRMVWFTRKSDLDPFITTNLGLPGMIPEKVYYNRSNVSVALQPGQYLVVGPRNDTYIGQRDQTNAPLKHRPSAHRIRLQPGWTQIWSDLNYPDLWLGATPPFPLPMGEPLPQPSQFLQNSFSLVVSAKQPSGWTTISEVGLNISEPTPDSYYFPEPTDQLNSNDNGTDPLTNATGFQNLPKDAYIDLKGAGNSPYGPFDLNSGFPLVKAGWNTKGDPSPNDLRPNVESRADWSTALLQRLANPDQPWHDVFNPYVTVDWMPIDLTVFSGEHPILPDKSPIHFGSRQKTGVYVNVKDDIPLDSQIPDKGGRTFYSYHPEDSPNGVATNGGGEPPHFGFTMPLEYADRPNDSTDKPVDRIDKSTFKNVGDFVTLGYLNSRFGLRGMNSESTHTDYAGSAVYYPAPGNPQPSVAPFWANRDFVNSYELMNVPLSSPGQFMQEFTADQVAGEVPFKHTLDFEMTTVPNSSLIEKKASLLLELIAPRNPWVESESVLNPSQMYVAVPTNDQERLINEALLIYRAPFNRLPRFIEPGKVNMNTAAQESVFRGLMWSAITPAALRNTVNPIPFQNEFRKSRSNLSPSSQLPQPNPRLDGKIPTEFPGLMKSGFSTPVTYAGLQSPYNTVTTGLLRPDVLGTSRLFATSNLINTGTSLPFNAFVTNQAVSRLANLTTDQSNVFAVRVTIGYFEYDAATGLGAEYGLEEGKARRHRAFYVIDRSVPAAYQEGQDMNTDNCILIRRIIE